MTRKTKHELIVELLAAVRANQNATDQMDDAGNWYPWSECELFHKLVSAARQEDREGRPRGYMLGLVHPPVDPARLKNFVFASRL